MKIKFFSRGIETLRQPDRNPRCYDLTDQERLLLVKKHNNRNVWNTLELAREDEYNVYRMENK